MINDDTLLAECLDLVKYLVAELESPRKSPDHEWWSDLVYRTDHLKPALEDRLNRSEP